MLTNRNANIRSHSEFGDPEPRARTFSPTLMRWVQQDPLGTIDGLNLYGFVVGNPIAFTDSTGLSSSFDTSGRGLGTPLLSMQEITAEFRALGRWTNPTRIRRLVRDLGHQEFNRREHAQSELEQLGEHAIPFIRGAMQSPDPEVSERANNIYQGYISPIESVTVDKNIISVDETATVTVKMKPNWRTKMQSVLPDPTYKPVPFIKQSVNNDDIIQYESALTIPPDAGSQTYTITGLKEGAVDLEVIIKLYSEDGKNPYFDMTYVGGPKKVTIRVCK